MFLSCWRQQHHCRREFDSCLPAARAHARLGTLLSILHHVTNPRGCTSTRILWRCSAALRLTAVLSTPPLVCIWLLHHFSAMGKAQGKWELGEAPQLQFVQKRSEGGRIRHMQGEGANGGKASLPAQRVQVKQALSWGEAHTRGQRLLQDTGVCTKNIQME